MLDFSCLGVGENGQTNTWKKIKKNSENMMLQLNENEIETSLKINVKSDYEISNWKYSLIGL